MVTFVSARGFVSIALCPRVYAPPNGHVIVNGLGYGGMARYSCRSGFILIPATSRIRQCLYGGYWTGVPPVCSESFTR